MNDVSPAWQVACLCAAWCRTCDEYRPTFDALAREFGAQAVFRWVDIEDDEAALGDVDVVDFPTLLVAHGDTVRFYGPVLPHAQTARQLIERALRHELPAVHDAALDGLPARLAVRPA
ncbi:MAG: thioredoxin family protein [Piscinibacter sp.]|nr:thioredoxin family protein [Piscinibacter sp.]